MKEKILIVEDELIIANHLALILKGEGYHVCGIARSMQQALDLIELQKPQLVLLDIFLKGSLTGIDLAKILNEKNIAFVYLSANSNQSVLEAAKLTRPYGFMIKPFREEEVLIALDIARYRHQNSLEADLRREIELQDQFSKIVSSNLSCEKKLLVITSAIQPYIPFDLITMGSVNPDQETLWCGFFRTGFNEYQTIFTEDLLTITGLKSEYLKKIRMESPVEIRPSFLNCEEFDSSISKYPMHKLYATTFNVKSNLIFPLLVDHKAPFVLSFFSKAKTVYDGKMIKFLGRIQQSLSETLLQIVNASKLEQKQNNRNNKTNITTSLNSDRQDITFPGIIGKSQPLLLVLDYVKQVAGVDTSVLILGETGTGKEKIAQHIHNLSARQNNPLIKVNCASLPLNLIESELFGHEKGSFTGASAKRIGRFEQADGGTIFLDEIGEVPLEVQVKLLRVLQEKEIERIGSQETIKIDVRIITATNKCLEKEVAEGRFRMDLYYRLNVFPILLPPLRKRIEDIPLLTDHFIDVYARKCNKNIKGILPSAMEQLMRYHWPGNVRELENSIERSVVLTEQGMINTVFIQSPHLSQITINDNNAVKTIEEVEKEHILIVLHKCNQKVYGPGGAAEMLNLPPTTLTSKMKKLGISKD